MEGGKEEKFLPPPAINCDLWSAPTLYSKINKSDRALSLFDFELVLRAPPFYTRKSYRFPEGKRKFKKKNYKTFE